jgi:hypothetical protein
MRQAHAVSAGVKKAGGTPREFCTITVTDGIAMGHEGMRSSLVSREVIADSVELTMRGHCYDALVGVAGCDKSLPGMMMAMLRLNVPSVFLYGGSIMPGRWQGRTSPWSMCSKASAAFGRQDEPRSDLCDLESTPARATAPAAASSPPTPWPASPKPSAWRCRCPRPCRRDPESRDDLRAQGLGRGGDAADRGKPAPARHLHPQGVRERRRGGGRHRRLDQWRRCICRPWPMKCGIKFTLRDVARSSSARPISPT